MSVWVCVSVCVGVSVSVCVSVFVSVCMSVCLSFSHPVRRCLLPFLFFVCCCLLAFFSRSCARLERRDVSSLSVDSPSASCAVCSAVSVLICEFATGAVRHEEGWKSGRVGES